MAKEEPKPERKPRQIAQVFKGSKTARDLSNTDPKTDRFPALTDGLDAVEQDGQS
jgi:hypothetical protein